MHLFGAAGSRFVADYLEQVAAMIDLHAQAQLDLAQVFVERAAQVGQAGVVVGVEREVALVDLGHKRARVARGACKNHRAGRADRLWLRLHSIK